MKIQTLLLLCIVTPLFSLSLVLNSAKESGNSYAILHIEDIQPFSCEIIPQPQDKEIYLCAFDRIVKAPINAKNMPLVEIDFLEKEKNFYIRIMPKVSSKIVPVGKGLFESDEVGLKEEKSEYAHWSILLFEKEPFKQADAKEGINFPIYYPKQQKPFVGALDLNGAPISYVRGDDIREYMRIKEKFEDKKYQDVAEDALDIVEKFPTSIFQSELLLYRLRAMDRAMDERVLPLADEVDRNDIIDEAKQWIKTFSSDENIPEVLMIIAKSYLSVGFKSDANYFLDILISEHENSSFTKRAILDFADSLYNTREKDKAIKLYLDVLYSAQDLDVAASAAIKLADKAMNDGQDEQAREYLLKVLGANKEYLLQDRQEAYNLAQKLAQNSLYDVAASVVDVLLSNVKKADENKEDLMRDSGIWHARANNVNQAYASLQRYLDEYKYGQYKEEVQEALDNLFFELQEDNETKLAQYYDTLIDKYENKISDKALVEKAKLLLRQERFEDVLKMQSSLDYIADDNASEAKSIILDAAQALSRLDIQNDDCSSAINRIEEYSLELDNFESDKIFECLLRTSRFEKAVGLSSKMVEDTVALSEKKIWMERYVRSLYGKKSYDTALQVGEDLEKIAGTLKQKVGYEALYTLFFSAINSDRFDEALDLAKAIHNQWPKNLANSDIYMRIIKEALASQNNLLLSEYAKKILVLQKEHGSDIQTPFVEFHYITALQRLGNNEEALKVVKELLQKQLQDSHKIRAFYSAGEINIKLGKRDDAKRYFEECVAIEGQSSWKDICEQNLKLF